jgi:hypothetical protein
MKRFLSIGGQLLLLLTLLAAGCDCRKCPDATNPDCPQSGCTVATINVLSPLSGTLLGTGDDTTAGGLLPGAIGADVVVEALDADGNPVANTDIELRTNGGAPATATTDANGLATFTDFPLEADAGQESVVNVLAATEAGCAGGGTGNSSVVVDVAPPLCAFVTPEDNASLTCADDQDMMPLNGVQIPVTVSSDAGNNRTVRLTINGDTTGTMVGMLTAGSVTFVSTLPPGNAMPSSLVAECVDGAGNVGTGTINVTVDCQVPTCVIDSLDPLSSDPDMCIDLAVPADTVQTVSFTVNGLGNHTTTIFLTNADNPAGVAIGMSAVNAGSAVVGVNAPPFVDGAGNTLTCVATDIDTGDTTFGVVFPLACVDTETADAAPAVVFPSCPATLVATSDTDPGTPGFQYDLTLQICCVNWTLDVQCPAGTSVGTYGPPPAGPADPACVLVPVNDVTLLVDTSCDLVTTCLDDSDMTTVTTGGCSGFFVSSMPVLTIVAPSPGAQVGTPDVTFTVTELGLPAGTAVCLFESGVVIPGSTSAMSGSGPMTLTATLSEGTHTVQADTCTPLTGGTTPGTVTFDVDLTPPLPPTGLSCLYLNKRTGETQCTWTVPATSGVASTRLRWGKDSATFDFTTVFSGTIDFPAPGGGLETEMFLGPRIGNDVTVAVASVDAAGNVSAPTGPLDLGLLLPDSFVFSEGADPEDRFGAYVAGVGDVNCDGIDDILVSADGYPMGNYDGRVFLYFGVSGMNPNVAWAGGPDVTIDETDPMFGFLGSGVAALGDVNGDGCDDIGLALPGWRKIHIILGSPSLPTSMTTSTGLRIAAPASYSGLYWGYGGFAQSSITGGDVDGDGLSDLIFGSDDYPIGAGFNGRVFVVLGQTDADRLADPRWVVGERSSDDADVIITGDAAGDSLGSSLAYLGPVEPGSVADPTSGRGFVAGAPRYASNGGSDIGYASVFTWPVATGNASAVEVARFTTSTADNFGSSVAGVGDFDGSASGLGGAAVGSRDGMVNGVVYVFLNGGLGLFDTASTAADATLLPPTAGGLTHFGFAMAGGWIVAGSRTGMPASFDSDTLPDLIMGDNLGVAPGRVHGLYGSSVLPSSAPPYDFDLPGIPGSPVFDQTLGMVYAGDVNNDTYLDILVGYPFQNGDIGAAIIYY